MQLSELQKAKCGSGSLANCHVPLSNQNQVHNAQLHTTPTSTLLSTGWLVATACWYLVSHAGTEGGRQFLDSTVKHKNCGLTKNWSGAMWVIPLTSRHKRRFGSHHTLTSHEENWRYSRIRHTRLPAVIPLLRYYRRCLTAPVVLPLHLYRPRGTTVRLHPFPR